VAHAGDELVNPVSGQRLAFLRTTEDTRGELLEVESTYQAGGQQPPVHYHPRQEERFEVLTGTVEILLGEETRTLRQGEVLTVRAGSPHSIWSRTGGRVNWQTRPAGKTEAFFELVWGLARDGKVDRTGRPNLLQSAVLARAYRQEWRLARPPYGIQVVLFGVLAPVGRLLGYRASYPR
jgi:mannose-6-phosphate isomerase-like protein (cupin superfamily)